MLSGIDALLAERDADPQRSIANRLRKAPVPELARSDPNAYFVTRAFDAWNGTGVEGAAAWLSPWVELVDPPEWPGSATWRGRETVLRRLQAVTTELGAAWVEVTGARSDGDEEVLVTFALRDDDGRLTEPPAFHARAELADQIVRIVMSLHQP